MAKRPATIPATEHKIEDFAEDLGKMLGHARGKAEGWLSQRQSIVKNLTALRDEASKLLADLGHEATDAGSRGRAAVRSVVSRVKRGRSTLSKNTAGVQKKRTMSANARAAISAAQKARWAKVRAGKK